MILDFKKLNKHVQYNHFKMDNFRSVISLVTPNCFLASVDQTRITLSLLRLHTRSTLSLNGVVNCVSSPAFLMV